MLRPVLRRSLSLALATILAIPLATLDASVFLARADDAVAPADTGNETLWSYEENYQKNVENVCKKAWNPDEGSLVQAKDVVYPQIGSKTAEQQYREGVRSVGGDVSRVEELFATDIPTTGNPFGFWSDVSRASEVYKERMNGIFACAQINFKIRTHEQLLKTIKGEKAGNGNTAKKVEEQTRLLRQEMGKRKCADRTSTEGKDNIMLKKDLLRQTTYEYCNYRHYLQYLKFNAQNRLWKFITSEQKRAEDNGGNASSGSSLTQWNAEALGMTVANVVVSIDQEIAHTREVYPQSMIAYTEFERTYASHVVMLFILEDYALLRDSLKRIMNPLGQVIYKASNAQSPFSR